MGSIRNTISWILSAFSLKRPKDLRVVLVCIFLTTILWLLNALNKDYTTKIAYPIKLDYDPSGVVAMEEPPRKVDINVSGYGWNLFRKTLGFRVEPLVINLENPAYTKYLTAGQLYPAINEQLRDVKLNYIILDTLYLQFESKIQKKVPLRVDSQNISLENNYRIVSSIQLAPDSVIFEGAVSKLNNLPEYILLNVPGRNIRSDYNSTVSLDYPNVPFVELKSTEVNIKFKTALFIQKTRQVPVTYINFPSNLEKDIQDSLVNITYTLNENNAAKVAVDTFKVVADYRYFNRQDSTIIVELTKRPAGVFDISIQPSVIRIKDEK